MHQLVRITFVTDSCSINGMRYLVWYTVHGWCYDLYLAFPDCSLDSVVHKLHELLLLLRQYDGLVGSFVSARRDKDKFNRNRWGHGGGTREVEWERGHTDLGVVNKRIWSATRRTYKLF